MATINSMSDLDIAIEELIELAETIDEQRNGTADAYYTFAQLVDGEMSADDFREFVSRALRTWSSENFSQFINTIADIREAIWPLVAGE